jgi:hypothetical protein
MQRRTHPHVHLPKPVRDHRCGYFTAGGVFALIGLAAAIWL